MVMLSQGAAILLILFAAFLWGSWFQVVKHLKGYPLPALMLWIYLFAAIYIWIIIGVFKQSICPDGIFKTIMESKNLAVLMVFGGVCYAVGLQNQLTIIGKIGLIQTTSVTATCGIIFGTMISAFVGGLPANIPFGLLMLAACILVGATIMCQYSRILRDKDIGKEGDKDSNNHTRKNYKLFLLMLIFNSAFFITAYPFVMSKSVRTDLNPLGLPPLLCIGLLGIGQLIGTLIISSIKLTISKSWGSVFTLKFKRILILGLICGVCEYTGALLHSISSPVLSMGIAWPLMTTNAVWGYIWGFSYGEFKGSSRRTYIVLISGICMFIIGVIMITQFIYR